MTKRTEQPTKGGTHGPKAPPEWRGIAALRKLSGGKLLLFLRRPHRLPSYTNTSRLLFPLPRMGFCAGLASPQVWSAVRYPVWEELGAEPCLPTSPVCGSLVLV